MPQETRQMFALGTFDFPFAKEVCRTCEGGNYRIAPYAIGYKLFLYAAPGNPNKFTGYSVDVLGPATITAELVEVHGLLTLQVEKTYIYPHGVPKGPLTFTMPTKGWEEREVRDGQKVRILLSNGVYTGQGRLPDGTVYLGHASLVLFDRPVALTSSNLVLLQGVLGMTKYFNSEQMLTYLFFTSKTTT